MVQAQGKMEKDKGNRDEVFTRSSTACFEKAWFTLAHTRWPSPCSGHGSAGFHRSSRTCIPCIVLFLNLSQVLSGFHGPYIGSNMSLLSCQGNTIPTLHKGKLGSSLTTLFSSVSFNLLDEYELLCLRKGYNIARFDYFSEFFWSFSVILEESYTRYDYH